jgi:hypothetical protein
MQYSHTYYKELLYGFIRNSLAPEQVKELYAFIDERPEMYEQLMREPQMIELLEARAGSALLELPAAADLRVRAYLEAYMHNHPQLNQGSFRSGRVISLLQGAGKWWAAAILIIGITTAIMLSSDRHAPTPGANTALKVDVLPGKNGAILTLADGGRVLLDSLGNGVVTTQGKTTVRIKNGQLVYDAPVKENEALYNTMTTPKGRQYQLILPDGSIVWLNAASSITYPTAFIGNNRTVSITGEAYFEVAKNKSKPFYVKLNDMEVEVLGTRFNINAYKEEDAIRTTLLAGSVKVIQIPLDKGGSREATGGLDAHAAILNPGEQATLLQNATFNIQHNINTDQVMAWKNGMFNFNKLSLQEVLRQLSRWYDVEVVYEGTIPPKKFGGEIQRDLNLSEVLEGLQAIGLHFKIERKKLIVMP